VECQRRLDDLRRIAQERAERGQELRRALEEIDAVKPEPGELAGLDRERSILRNAEQVSRLVEELVELTHEGETPLPALGRAAARRAAELAGIDPELEEAAARLEASALELQDLGALFRDYRSRLQFDSHRLEEVESRRVALERLCLRYGPDERAVLDHRDVAREELVALETIDTEIDQVEGETRDTAERYLVAAAQLAAERQAAAERLAPEVERQFRALALNKARLDVELAAARGDAMQGNDGRKGVLSPRGTERATFRLAANPGEPFAPLHRAASGGELSRVMLALHAVVQDAGEGRVLVFDEVDAGVSGAVADAVGSRLSRLARRQQVLCVTHLPQVAAYADRHLAVSKSVRGGRTRAVIDELEGDARVGELAKMLGGKRATATSRRHATELLDAAGRITRGPRKAERGRRP
jgi:DNA repair protein RecN (Recombination protein N)